MSAHRAYSFGEFVLDMDRGALLKSGADVKLRPKAYEVLRLLIARHGQLVTKNELLDAVWGRVAVSDGSITQCLIDVRRAIGDDSQQMIRTVPRRGYIFDAPVVDSERNPVEGDEPPTATSPRFSVARRRALAVVAAVVILCAGVWLASTRSVDNADQTPAAAAAQAPRNSIAVLPFVDMSPEQNQEYLSDGVAEEIVNLLAQNRELQVTARTSSFSFKGSNADIPTIAARLNVSHVLEGSVRKAGNRVRVTAQLVDAATGSHLWSETYDRELEDTFGIQSDIAVRVAEALDANIASHSRAAPVTSDPQAYERFLQAQYFYNRRAAGDIDRARDYYEQALRRDPNFARAWAGLAGVYGLQSIGAEMPMQLNSKRREAVDRALALDPNSAEAHIRAAQYYRDMGAMDLGARHEQLALAADPDNPIVLGVYAGSLAWQRRLDEAIDAARRAVALNPISVVSQGNFAGYLLAAGRFEEAEEAFRRTRELHTEPTDPIATDYPLAVIFVLRGQPAAALDLIDAWHPGEDKDQILAFGHHALGQHEHADAAVRRLIATTTVSSAVRVAEIYAHRGEHEESLRWIATAANRLPENVWQTTDWRWIMQMRLSPFLRPLQGEPALDRALAAAKGAR